MEHRHYKPRRLRVGILRLAFLAPLRSIHNLNVPGEKRL